MDITSKDIEKFRKENPEKSLFLTDEKCIKLQFLPKESPGIYHWDEFWHVNLF